MVLDWAELPGLSRWLRRHVARKVAPTAALWRTSRAQFLIEWATDVQRGLVQVLTPHPYALRHGGASYDLLHARRRFEDVKARGRWFTDSSVRRYTKHARALKEAGRLSEEARSYGDRVWLRLNQYLDGSMSCPAPPRGVETKGKLRRGGQ